MKRTKQNKFVAWMTLMSLLISLCTGIIVSDKAMAQGNSNQTKTKRERQRDRASRVAGDLSDRVKHRKSDTETVKVIIQLNAPMSNLLKSVLKGTGVKVHGSFNKLNMQAVELPAKLVDTLSSFDELLYISPDREMKSLGHISATTGADNARQPAKFGNITTPGVDGTGVGIAIMDSGIDT